MRCFERCLKCGERCVRTSTSLWHMLGHKCPVGEGRWRTAAYRYPRSDIIEKGGIAVPDPKPVTQPFPPGPPGVRVGSGFHMVDSTAPPVVEREPVAPPSTSKSGYQFVKWHLTENGYEKLYRKIPEDPQ